MAGIHNVLAGSGAPFVFQATIAANTNNYNLRAAAVAAGWPTGIPLQATVTINSGVVVGSASTGTVAFDTGVTFPVGTILSLINNGTIAGAGGNGGYSAPNTNATNGAPGGPAVTAQQAISITNNGTIGGGGGGGGGGQAARTDIHDGPYGATADIIYVAGGGGGGGAGSIVGTGANGGQVELNNITQLVAETTAANGTTTTGGAGNAAPTSGGSWGSYGGSGASGFGGTGGTGGGLGASGGTGSAFTTGTGTSTTYTAGSGGAGGNCTTSGSNALITWAATGTRLGTLA